jgi:hypothetical protein
MSTTSSTMRAGLSSGVEVGDGATLHKLRMQHNSTAREQRNEMGYALNVNCRALPPRTRCLDGADRVERFLAVLGFAKATEPLTREDCALHCVPPAAPGGDVRWFVEKFVSGEPRFVYKSLDGDVRVHSSLESVVAELGGYEGVPPAAAVQWLEQ